MKEDFMMLQQISDAELEIMKVVWAKNKEPSLFAELTDELAAKGRPWQKNPLITLLNRLVNKGFLKAKKIGRRNEYTPLVSEAEYQTAQTKHFLEKLYEGSASGLVATLISGDLLTDEEYSELRQMLEKDEKR